MNKVHLSLLLCLSLLAGCDDKMPNTPPVVEEPPIEEPPITEQPPNILFVIMDDVGIDQMEVMGYGGFNPPPTPTIEAISKAGVRFRNTWSMPECSPGRAALLAGKYPLRTNMYQALGPNDLANSQLSPYATTVPKLLQQAGYESGLFGKFHLAGPELNPFEYATPQVLGWDYFYGWLGGLPASIDTTAGGVAAVGTYQCGYVPTLADDPVHGADSGACYTPSQCTELATNSQGESAGLQCLSQGGVLLPQQACTDTVPEFVVFDRENAHYVSELVINDASGVERVPLTDMRGRGYRSVIEAEAATTWINQRDGNQPWMATLSFSSAHTPLQPPPAALLPSQSHFQLAPQCQITDGNFINSRRISDAMIEGLDTALANVLIATGIATEGESGLQYNPDSNTVVVIVGDNGSFGPTVKLPFDGARAKGTAYQTGVWVPLIVGGAGIEQPDRAVEHLVNTTDVYGLFGEIAGLDAATIAAGGPDSAGLLAYLEDPTQTSLRDYNFTQGGLNIQQDGGRNGPCAFAAQCSHTPVSKGVCEDNGGVWWGVGADNPVVTETYQSGDLEQCWQVNRDIYAADPDNYSTNKIPPGWTNYQAIRNDDYKLVQNHALDFDPSSGNPVDIFSIELYQINQRNMPTLDTQDSDLLMGQGEAALEQLSTELQQQYADLNAALAAIMASQPACLGDGNDDGVVDQLDIDNYQAIVAAGWQGSSWYDVNFDAQTNELDLQLIEAAAGTVCDAQ